jgi:hypothetical protein
LRVVGDTQFDAVVEQARHNSDAWSMARANVISGQVGRGLTKATENGRLKATMPIPELRLDGYLSDGLHFATEAEVEIAFGTSTMRLQTLMRG